MENAFQLLHRKEKDMLLDIVKEKTISRTELQKKSDLKVANFYNTVDDLLKYKLIKKDEVIDNHTSVKDAAVCVIDGEIEIHFAAEKFEIKKGEILMFEKEKEHKVLAKKDSKFLLIKI